MKKYLVYGVFKVYNNDGVIGLLNDKEFEFEVINGAVDKYKTLILNEMENDCNCNDYDFIYLDYLENDNQECIDCWERPVLIN